MAVTRYEIEIVGSIPALIFPFILDLNVSFCAKYFLVWYNINVIRNGYGRLRSSRPWGTWTRETWIDHRALYLAFGALTSHKRDGVGGMPVEAKLVVA